MPERDVVLVDKDADYRLLSLRFFFRLGWFVSTKLLKECLFIKLKKKNKTEYWLWGPRAERKLKLIHAQKKKTKTEMLISIYQHSLNLRPFFKPLFESGQAGSLATIKRTLFFNTTISDRFKPVLHSSARQGAIESPGLTAYVAYAQFSRPPCNTTLEKLEAEKWYFPTDCPTFPFQNVPSYG